MAVSPFLVKCDQHAAATVVVARVVLGGDDVTNGKGPVNGGVEVAGSQGGDKLADILKRFFNSYCV